jgi:ribosome-binding protein aMBF1 (putative translation factor)
MLVASRVALEISLGRQLDATENALHRCDNTLCVRPDHLFVGTDRDNTQDMIKKGRHPQMRLTAQQANDIRRRRATEGVSQRALAREYGVDPSCISKIVNHQRQLEV